MIKLITTDIDGTLLEQGTLTLNPEYYDVIREFRKKGTLFIAASGRQKTSIERVFEPIKDDIIFLSENGAVISSKEYNHAEEMDPFVVRSIIEDARSLGCTALLCAANRAYTEDEHLYHHMLDDYGYEVAMVDDLMKVEDVISKVSVFHIENAEEAVGQEFMKKWNPQLYLACAGDNWLDCMNLGVNKGNSVKRFQEHYHISKDETLAFGDNTNDIEMLHRAAHSFAVADARQEVKEAANFVAPSCKEDGVLQVLKAVLAGELCGGV